MAKGEAAIPIPVPRSGWHTDQPINLIPADALADGLNLVVDRDGLLRVRRGYEPLPFQPDVSGEADPRIMGGFAWSEVGNQMIVVATPTQWWLLQSDGWVNITGAQPQEGDEPGVPARFAQLGFVEGQQELFGVNGAGHSPMRKWHLTDPISGYETMMSQNPTNDPNLTTNLTFAANDILVLNNRLVLVYTDEEGVINPRRIRWSSVNDGNSWPGLAFVDQWGDVGNLVCGQPTSRTTAVIYAQNGAWIMSAQAGLASDAEAFVFDRLNGAYAAPWSPTSIVNIGGVHYYLATDRHIWKCDGQSAQPISSAIDAGLLRIVSTDADQGPVALYDSNQFRLWFFFENALLEETVGEDQEGSAAVAYDLLTGAWSVPQQFPGQISMAMSVIEQAGPTWDNPGTDAGGNDYTWDTAPWANWNSIPQTNEPAIYIGLSTGLVCRFGTAVTDNGTPIPYSGVWGQRTPQDPREMLNVDTVEIYLQPTQEQETVQVLVRGFQTPYDDNPVTILDRQVPQNDISQWLMETDPEPLVPAGSFKNALFMQLSIAGTSATGLPAFSGAYLYSNVLRRADLGVRSANG